MPQKAYSVCFTVGFGLYVEGFDTREGLNAIIEWGGGGG